VANIFILFMYFDSDSRPVHRQNFKWAIITWVYW